jgi:hypothetical protein
MNRVLFSNPGDHEICGESWMLLTIFLIGLLYDY